MKTNLLGVLSALILLLLPTMHFAQAPPLGTAANFVLFSSVGAVTNVGTYKYLTHLTGNVGTNSGSSTNFGNVNGVMHDGDGASTQCAADLLLAYNTLSASIPDSTLGTVIGNGTTIRPGIFLLPGATSLNLDLTLNGQGNPNSVFIFKTPSAVAYAFTANPNSKIRLINGAQACNVFWQVSGAVNINAGVSMKGSIIAHGAITMGALDTLEGRALTVNGAITVSNGALGLLAYTPIGCGSPVLVGPVAPTFVASGSYAVFATTGSASDCGTSRIIGDVGGNTVAPTGFNPDSVTGTIHFNDPSTNAAAGDLLLVYNYLLGLPYDIKLMDPAEFGHNLVLTPHAYQMDAAVTFTDTLYLDAQGDPDAVFIIKTFGAFATTPGAKVILLNGTQAKNVYWFCSAAVSIGANSIFKGAIIAHDAIDMLPGSKLSGRVFSTHGAISTCGMTASLPSLISTEPADQTACAGTSVSFSVTASGSALTYQWRKGTLHLTNGGNISGATTSTLTINPVSISDAAVNYNVIIMGTAIPNDTSRNATLTVNPLPVPVITGPASVCVGSTGKIYATASGMSNYVWTISGGGIITAGTGTNSITVSWNTAGPQTVSVTYKSVAGCQAASPTVYNVTANSLPVPVVSGPASACAGNTGKVYITEPGMTAYSWIVSAGGIVTAGTGTNSITVTWNTVGPQTVSVTYTSASGCPAVSPTVYNVTVNALPVPVIVGTTTACQGNAYTYTTQTGQNAYVWSVSSGGLIVSGQGTSSLIVNWNGLGAHTVSVNYSNSGGCAAASPVTYGVTVHALPVPTITGINSVCIGTTGVVYTTQAGMTNYLWDITGGIITAGGSSTSNTATVTWNTTGTQSIVVNYINSNGCTSSAPSNYPVTVLPMTGPAGIISGPVQVCQGGSGYIYNVPVISAANTYNWTLPVGGTVTAGGGTNTITVSYGSAAVTGYVIVYGLGTCSNGAPSQLLVNANAPAVPVISGPVSACAGSTGNVYSTQAGMTGYIWNVPAGGLITSGAGTNSITVTWNTSGAQSVSLNYLNLAGCQALIPTTYSVTVNPLPTPSISGNATVCQGTTTTYSTQTGQGNYVWTVSSGGQILTGQGTSAVNVKWNGIGAQTASVNYSTPSGCQAVVPVSYPVTVNIAPVPSITGTTSLCATSGYYAYTTEPGMTGYNWSISSGGSVFTGQGTNTLFVYWGTVGAQTVSVNYSNSSGCQAIAPSVMTVNVYTVPGAAGAVSGPAAVCAGQQGVNYSIAPVVNATAYAWNVPAGAIITSGEFTNSITVDFSANAQNGAITAQANTICGSGAASPPLNVTISPLPAAAGSITGSVMVCEGAMGVAYSVGAISLATGYTWSLPAGATISGGANTNSITVNFGTVSGNVSVTGTNACGAGLASPAYAVTLSPKPITPFISAISYLLTSSAVAGNQWYHDGTAVNGATAQTYTVPADKPGWYWTKVTLLGCPSDESNHLYMQGVGIGENPGITFSIYPVPNNGSFTASFTYPTETAFDITVYNELGVMIHRVKNIPVKGTVDHVVDLRPVPPGVYTVVLTNSETRTIRKVLVSK